jgi:hypothetical protein
LDFRSQPIRVFTPTYYLYRRFLLQETAGRWGAEAGLTLALLGHQRGLELGYIDHKPRGGLMYSALQSAWHGFFFTGFCSREAVVDC